MLEMVKKSVIRGKCVDISSEGKGVIKTVYGVVFVDSLLLGEEAEVEISYPMGLWYSSSASSTPSPSSSTQ